MNLKPHNSAPTWYNTIATNYIEYTNSKKPANLSFFNKFASTAPKYFDFAKNLTMLKKTEDKHGKNPSPESKKEMAWVYYTRAVLYSIFEPLSLDKLTTALKNAEELKDHLPSEINEQVTEQLNSLPQLDLASSLLMRSAEELHEKITSIIDGSVFAKFTELESFKNNLITIKKDVYGIKNIDETALKEKIAQCLIALSTLVNDLQKKRSSEPHLELAKALEEIVTNYFISSDEDEIVYKTNVLLQYYYPQPTHSFLSGVLDIIPQTILPAMNHSAEKLSPEHKPDFYNMRASANRYNLTLRRYRVQCRINNNKDGFLDTFSIIWPGTSNLTNDSKIFIIKTLGNAMSAQELLEYSIQEFTRLINGLENHICPSIEMVIYDYPGVMGSKNITPYSMADLVASCQAQIDEVISMGASNEDILVEGISLGGTVASLAVADPINKGTKLFADRSPISVLSIVKKIIGTDLKSILSDWSENALDAFLKIDKKLKSVVGFHPGSSFQDTTVPPDCSLLNDKTADVSGHLAGPPGTEGKNLHSMPLSMLLNANTGENAFNFFIEFFCTAFSLQQLLQDNNKTTSTPPMTLEEFQKNILAGNQKDNWESGAKKSEHSTSDRQYGFEVDGFCSGEEEGEEGSYCSGEEGEEGEDFQSRSSSPGLGL